MSPRPFPAPRPAPDCRWDIVALGEVKLRLDPGEGRIRTARSFDVWEGGGDYNVARALAKGFGLRAAILPALPDSEIGRLVEDLIAQGGVAGDHIVRRPFDGVGRNTRVGLNFPERGFGLRPALGVSDRAGSAASQLGPEEVDWDRLFGVEGVRWLHTGGIFAALSPRTAETALAAVQAARRHGTIVSYDLNYRASLWDSHPDPDAARRVNRRIAEYVDVMIGDEHGFRSCLGLEFDNVPPRRDGLDDRPFRAVAPAFVSAFPRTAIVAAPLREPVTATRNHWSAALYAEDGFHHAQVRRDLEILDRVGGGDGFVSGLVWALLNGLGPAAGVEWGAAHGALVMTTPGDASMASCSEVEALLAGGDGRALR